MNMYKEMSREPTGHSDVQHRRNAGLPSRREPDGSGTIVVVVGVASHLGERESRSQGEGWQVTSTLRITRYARCEQPTPS